jgi:hypothetical protein
MGIALLSIVSVYLLILKDPNQSQNMKRTQTSLTVNKKSDVLSKPSQNDILSILKNHETYTEIINKVKRYIEDRTHPSSKSSSSDNNKKNVTQSIGPLSILQDRSPKKVTANSIPIPGKKKQKGAIDIHFIHIPKAGGTSMTSILRQVVCQIDQDRNDDCCTNPGFCDWHAFRRCKAIKGCTDHFPNRSVIDDSSMKMFSVTPSAYVGHSYLNQCQQLHCSDIQFQGRNLQRY